MRGLLQREPLIDEEGLKNFMQVSNGLMKEGIDSCWILPGKVKSNAAKVEKQINNVGWKFETFFGIYDHKKMAVYGYWRREKGLANSKKLEPFFLLERQGSQGSPGLPRLR